MEIWYGRGEDIAKIPGSNPKEAQGGFKTIARAEKVQMVAYGDRIEMIPLKKISEMKGFLKGIDTTVKREF
jgi:hypothetical protein